MKPATCAAQTPAGGSDGISRRPRHRGADGGAGGRQVGEPVRAARVRRAQARGRGVRVPAGGAGHQERAAARVQPRAQEDARPPRRSPRLRVAGHPTVRRRGLRRRRAAHPLRRPLRPRRPPLLGRVRRRQAPGGAPDAAGDDRRRQGRGGGAGGRGARAARVGLRGVQQGEALLRRRRHRVPGHRPRLVRRVVPGGGEGHGAASARRGEDAPANGVGGAVLRARGRRGRGARRRQARGVRRGSEALRAALAANAPGA
uniref:Uncharacterized protein n=1 Tax=Arundo donax TaxID=35708 RepID=A0A0A8XN28_ARUDO